MESATKTRYHVINGLLFLLLLILSQQDAFAAGEQFGKTILARGNVTADRNNERAPLKRLSPLFRQDILRSGNNARGQFRMIDNALINLQQNSVLRLEKYELKSAAGDGSVLMELISGGLRTITGAIGKQDKNAYQLRTPVATIGIRGTLYEVEIADNGLYVAAWQGNIRVRSYSGQCDIELGDDVKNRFVFVDRLGVCRILALVPNVFREGHSSDVATTQDVPDFKVGYFQEDIPNEFPFRGLAVGLSDNSLEKGVANSLNSQTPNIALSGGVASYDTSSATNAITNFQSIGGYTVSWGRWADYTLNLGSVNDSNGLLWSTYQPSQIGVVSGRSGQVTYDSMMGSLSQSTLGQVNNLAVQMDVDFTNGVVSNGAISAQVPNHTWVGTFNGQVSGGELNLGFNGGALVDSQTGAFTNASGDIAGDFVGNNAQAIVGGFNMTDDTNNANQIEGVFLVEQ